MVGSKRALGLGLQELGILGSVKVNWCLHFRGGSCLGIPSTTFKTQSLGMPPAKPWAKASATPHPCCLQGFMI